MNQRVNNRIVSSKRTQTVAKGFSLLELAIVLVILIAVATIILPVIQTHVVVPGGEVKSANEIATETTLRTLRDAIVSESGVLQNLSHEPNALPRKVSELASDVAPEHVQIRTPELTHFDPFFGIGWRGPYVLPTGINELGAATIVDGWGKEIEVHIDFNADGEVDEQESRYMRFVSGGPNGKVETPVDRMNMKPGKNSSNELTRSDCGDDLVVFVSIPDDRQ